MASITSNGTVIVRVAAGLYGLAPGNAIYTELVNASYTGGVNALINNLYTSDFGAQTTKAVAATIVANLGITGDAASGAANFVEGQLTATAASARGAKVVELLNLFAGLTDATYGAAATAWNTKVTNAVTTAQTAGSSDAAFATVSSALIGKAFALTAGIDASVGTAGNDTFSGTQDTTNTTDSIDGGTGADTFVFTSSAAGVALGAGVTNVETLTLTLTGDTSSAFDVKSATGYTTVKVLNTAFNSSVSNIAKAAKVVLENVTGNKTATIAYLASDLTGAADSVTLELNRVGTSAQGITISAADSGIETQVVNSTGATANNVASATFSNSTKTLTITGDQKLTISDLAITTPALKTVDASANTAGVSIDLVVGSARDLSVTGGAGNDTFTFGGTLTIDDTVNGGEGTDTVSVDAAIGSTVTLTSIEAVTYTTNTVTHAATQANLANLKTVAAAGNTVTISSGASNGIALVAVATSSTFEYNLKTGTDGSSDSVSLQNGLATSTAAVDTTFKSNAIETLNITNSTKTAGTVNTLTVSAPTSGNSAVSRINVTGNADTKIADSGAYTSELVVDASASSGALEYNGVTSVAETILGAAGNDSFIFAAGEFTTDDSVNGGEGNDSLTVTATTNVDNAFGRIYTTAIENIAVAAVDQDKTTSIDLRGASGLVAVTATITDVGTGATSIDNLPATVTKVTIVADETNTADTTAAGAINIDTDGGTALTVVLNSDDDSGFDAQFGASGARAAITYTGTATSYSMTQAGTGGDKDFLTLTANNATSLALSTASRPVDISTLSANKLTTLTVTGSNALTISAASVATGSKLATIDAASATGAITLGGSTVVERAASAVITTGSGDDSIQFGLSTDGANTINAGLNSTVSPTVAGDTLKLTGLLSGVTSIDLSSASDQVVTANGVASAGAQIGFEAVDGSSLTSAALTGLTVTGSSGINNIVGSAGNDTIDGAGGNDIITGGAGNDIMVGGAGVDTFVLGATALLTGVDTIADFVSGTDKLDLNAFESVGTLVDAATTFTTTAGTVIYLTGAAAGVADSAAAAVAAFNTAATNTSAAVTAWFIVSDDNSAAVYQWADTTGAAEMATSELTLIATITGVVLSTDLVIA